MMKMFDFSGYGTNTAFMDDSGNELTYSELESAASKIRSVVPERSLVISLCSNTMGSAVGYLSFIDNGIVPLMLDEKIEKELLANLLESYTPQFIFLPADMTEAFPEMECVLPVCNYSLLRTPWSEPGEINEELALLLTTSGSTGSPKFVRQSYTNVLSNAQAIAEYLEIDEKERAITTLPMNYTYGLSIINSHILKGACVLLTGQSLMMRGFWDFFNEKKATSFGGVPATYELLEKRRFFERELPTLKYFTQAGGKLPKDRHRRFGEWAEKHNKKFVVMYGQTEATARMSYLPADKCLEKCGSIGIAIPGGSFSLIDADGNVIEESGKEGELVYQGPNVTLGYAVNRNDLIKGDERNGRLVTGDMAYRDDDGYYYISGRKKRFLKIFGNRVNLDEADILIKKRFPGLDAASTGTDDHLVTYITDETLTNAVKEYISGLTHLSQSAFTVRYIDKIPRNESGKVLYKNLEQ